MISASVLMANSIGIPLAGSEKASHDGHCAMCGVDYHQGDWVEPFDPGTTFTDFTALAYPQATHVCGACKALWRREFMQTYSKVVVSSEGMHTFASNDNQAYWLLEPPEPPFLMLISDQQLMHIVWKTPVSMSKDLYFVRLGEKTLSIRRPMLIAARDAAHRLSDAINAKEAEKIQGKKQKEPKFRSPFLRLDRNFANAMHGQISPMVRILAEERTELRGDVELLERLTPGELWGLTSVLYAKSPTKSEAKRWNTI